MFTLFIQRKWVSKHSQDFFSFDVLLQIATFIVLETNAISQTSAENLQQFYANNCFINWARARLNYLRSEIF